jgi:hypothetical protein
MRQDYINIGVFLILLSLFNLILSYQFNDLFIFLNIITLVSAVFSMIFYMLGRYTL